MKSDNEELQLLTGQRQLGDVKLAKTPFCVVEVNQGMDSINECLAHNQMIETACQSQYFLITSEFLSDCNCKYHASYVGNVEWQSERMN
ncbi:12451_t:CDS:2 [Entrophospora sp. SA101]|nr:12451_t:CDS:2 [Entrophospora sp. SA101]CAJ0850675.1 16382_t:CDS:2 [Entrophospora sp. SA101]CAJ0920779.1 17007_t:CDS:2 [Entrophospora sp. SA101]CAJ0920792.1 17012_t:CDS:2 [Entrophospora sp. SA101]